MHCLLIDDNKTTARQLKELLELQKGVEAVHTAVHPYEVQAVLKNIPVALVFIRIKLWNFRQFENFQSIPVLVFLSSKHEKFKEEVQGEVDYSLCEPYNYSSIQQLFNRIEQEKKEVTADFFFIKFERRYRKIPFDTIELIERKMGNYVIIYTTKCTYLVSGTLNCWLVKLPKGRFIRVSDNLVMPKSELTKLTGNTYTFRGREITLTFWYMRSAKKEMELVNDCI